jgi:hypothetical protein
MKPAHAAMKPTHAAMKPTHTAMKPTHAAMKPAHAAVEPPTATLSYRRYCQKATYEEQMRQCSHHNLPPTAA